MKKVLLALLLCVGTLAFAQEKVLLRLNYEEGDKYEVKTVMNQDMGELMDMGISMTMNLNVTDTKDNSIVTEATFSKVKMTMDYMGQSMVYDSTMDESEMDEFAKGAHSEMKKLMETVMIIENDKLGNIKDTEIKTGIADVDSFKDNMSGMVYPEEAVGVGSKWTASKEQKGMNINSTYEVTSITDDTVEIKVTGTIAGASEGTLNGKSSIEIKTGNVIKSEVNMAFSIEGQEVKSDVIITSIKQ